MNNAKQDIKELNFVIQQIVFFQNNLAECVRQKRYKADLMHMLQNSKGRNLVCGRMAMQKLDAIARREYFVERENNPSTTLEVFKKEFKKQFIRLFIEEQKQVNKEGISRLIKTTHQQITVHYKKRTFFIPCALFSHAHPKEFQVGPISFMHISLFKERYEIQLKNDLSSKQTDKLFEDANKFLFTSKKSKGASPATKARYLRQLGVKNDKRIFGLYEDSIASYNWIARIDIAPCEMGFAKKRADYIIEQALNIMRVILGEDNSHKLKHGLDAQEPLEHMRIYLNDKGEFDYSARASTKEHHFKNWFEALQVGEFDLTVLGLILTKLSKLQKLSHLEERLLDALTWNGEAISEQAPGIKVIKFMSAFERLTLTGEREKITERVTTRSAWLIHCCWKEDRRKDLLRLYKLRSRLIHGAKSPGDMDNDEDVYLLSKLTRKLITSAVRFFHDCSKSNANVTRSELKKAYDTYCPIKKAPL